MIYKRLGYLICALSVWGCSLSLDSEKPFSLFFNPSADGSDLPELSSSDLDTLAEYSKTCYVLMGAGEYHQSEIKTMNVQYDGTGTQIEMVWLEFDIPRLAPGRTYSIELIGFKTLPTSYTKCPGVKELKNLKPYATLGSLKFKAPQSDSTIRLDYGFQEHTRDTEEDALSW